MLAGVSGAIGLFRAVQLVFARSFGTRSRFFRAVQMYTIL